VANQSSPHHVTLQGLNCASVVGRKIPLNRPSISGGCDGKGYWRKAFNFVRGVLKNMHEITFVFIYAQPLFYAFFVLTPLY